VNRTEEARQEMANTEQSKAQLERRAFLLKAGRFAAYTPPAMMILMSPGKYAIAKSGGANPKSGGGKPTSAGCNNGVGNGSDCLPPGLAKNGKLHLDNDDH